LHLVRGWLGTGFDFSQVPPAQPVNAIDGRTVLEQPPRRAGPLANSSTKPFFHQSRVPLNQRTSPNGTDIFQADGDHRASDRNQLQPIPVQHREAGCLKRRLNIRASATWPVGRGRAAFNLRQTRPPRRTPRERQTQGPQQQTQERPYAPMRQQHPSQRKRDDHRDEGKCDDVAGVQIQRSRQRRTRTGLVASSAWVPGALAIVSTAVFT